MRFLYLGDPHVQVNNIEESEKLMQFVLDTANHSKINTLIILGDLMHTHSVLRTQVLDFWSRWISILDKQEFNTFILVGNHDALSNSDMSLHSLKVFKQMNLKSVTIIDKPTKDINGFGYLPYIHKAEDFIAEANKLTDSLLICHGEFSGSQYENGYYSPHGVNPDELKAKLVISGHVHKRQRFGKVIHPGTARWLTNSEANHEKGLWLVDHSPDGTIEREEFIDSSSVCTPLISVTWNEGEDMPQLPENAKVFLELIGSQIWVTKQKSLLKGKVAISSKVTDREFVKIRKSGSNLVDFINNIYETKVDKEKLIEYLNKLNCLE